MEIRELRYFRAVVEAGSFMAAASALHMSQPPLSLAIRKLEDELGVRVLTRSARGVQPTSAGMHLLQAGSRVLGEVEDLVGRLRRFGAGTAGLLTVAAVPALMWSRVPEVLREHAVEHPEVEVQLVDPPPWTAIDMVVERRVDLALIIVDGAPAFAERHRDQFEAVAWEDVPMVVAFPPERTELPDPVPLAVFEAETLVVPRRTLAVPSLPDAVERALAAYRVVPRRIRTSETIQTGLALIQAGLGAAILPDAQSRSLVGTGLTVRRIAEPLPPLTAVAVLARGADASPAARRLLARIVPQPAER